MRAQTSFTPPPSCIGETISHRKRRGITSPPLVCIESNPGPRKQGRRKLANERQQRKSRKKLDDIEKGQILLGVKMNMTNTDIASHVQCCETTVRLWRDRYHQTGEMKRKAGSGRKRKFSEKEERYIRRMSMKNRKLTAIDIGREFIRPDGRLRASVTTIRSTLRRRGLFGRVARKKPLLTFAHIQRRIRWAKAHKDWTPEQWKCVVWSDEATFRLFPTTGKVYVRRGKGEEYKPQCVSPTVKYGGGKVSVWACCHAGGVGPMVRIDFIIFYHMC